MSPGCGGGAGAWVTAPWPLQVLEGAGGEKGVATHASILAWTVRRTEKPGRTQPTGSQSGHDQAGLHAETRAVVSAAAALPQ